MTARRRAVSLPVRENAAALVATVRAGFGRPIAWDEAIAACLRVFGWSDQEIAALFRAADGEDG